MGREIRRVPPNWEHPKREPENDPYGHGGYQPMFDENFEDRFEEWLADFDRIRSGSLTDFEQECYPRGLSDWLLDDGRVPDRAYYRDYKDNERSWYQVYETVSEGTPVTPAFETKEELATYLARNGDFWDQKRCHKPQWTALYGGAPGVSAWGRTRAEAFVNAEWAPTAIVRVTHPNPTEQSEG